MALLLAAAATTSPLAGSAGGRAQDSQPPAGSCIHERCKPAAASPASTLLPPYPVPLPLPPSTSAAAATAAAARTRRARRLAAPPQIVWWMGMVISLHAQVSFELGSATRGMARCIYSCADRGLEARLPRQHAAYLSLVMNWRTLACKAPQLARDIGCAVLGGQACCLACETAQLLIEIGLPPQWHSLAATLQVTVHGHVGPPGWARAVRLASEYASFTADRFD